MAAYLGREVWRDIEVAMKKAVPIIISLILLIGLVYLIRWDIQHPEISFFYAFLTAQILSALVVGLVGLRGYILAQRKITYLLALRANGLALMTSFFLPARLGELGKPLYFKKLNDLPQSEGLAIVVKERVWDLVGFVCLLMLVPSVAYVSPYDDQVGQALWIVTALGIIAFFGMLMLPRFIKAIPFFRRFEDYAEAMKQDSWWENVIQLILSVIIWAASLLLFIVFYNSTGLPDLSVFELGLVFLLSTLGLIVTVTPGGLGTYEAVIVSALTGLGIDWDSALTFAIGFRFCWMAIPLIMGSWAIIKDGSQLLSMNKKAN